MFVLRPAIILHSEVQVVPESPLVKDVNPDAQNAVQPERKEKVQFLLKEDENTATSGSDHLHDMCKETI